MGKINRDQFISSIILDVNFLDEINCLNKPPLKKHINKITCISKKRIH